MYMINMYRIQQQKLQQQPPSRNFINDGPIVCIRNKQQNYPTTRRKIKCFTICLFRILFIVVIVQHTCCMTKYCGTGSGIGAVVVFVANAASVVNDINTVHYSSSSNEETSKDIDNDNDDCFVCYKQKRTMVKKTSNNNNNDNDKIQTEYHTIMSLPLIGLGVGNMDHTSIVNTITVAAATTNNNYIILFDTAHASANEHLVRQGIDQAITEQTTNSEQQQRQSNPNNNPNNNEPTIVTFHVITKIWYTYLGYNRTILSIQESMNELVRQSSSSSSNSYYKDNNIIVNINVHMLLHWPRCRTDISWMDCIGEEKLLSNTIKTVGPDPSLDPDNAYLHSWKALEDTYIEHYNTYNNKKSMKTTKTILQKQKQQQETTLHNLRSQKQQKHRSTLADDNNNDNKSNIDNNVNIRIVSIGVSNFDKNDITHLLNNNCIIIPHIIQDNVWTYLFDKELRTLYLNNNIHYQVYNVMNGIVQNYNNCPNTYSSLVYVSKQLLIYTKNVVDFVLSTKGTTTLTKQHQKQQQQETSSLQLFITNYNNSSIIQQPTVTQVILSWLVQQNVSIIPRSSNRQHIHENSPMVLYPYILTWEQLSLESTINDNQQQQQQQYERLSIIIENCIKSLLQNNDIQSIEAKFDNSNNTNQEWDIYWVEIHTDENEEKVVDHYQQQQQRHLVTTIVSKGIFYTGTHPGHIFIAVPKTNENNNETNEIIFTITAMYGEQQIFTLPTIVANKDVTVDIKEEEEEQHYHDSNSNNENIDHHHDSTEDIVHQQPPNDSLLILISMMKKKRSCNKKEMMYFFNKCTKCVIFLQFFVNTN